MTLVHFFFYLFSAVAIAAAVMVISSRNPVHSVLFLILAFFNAAGIFMISGAEFLALILVVVYVGAVAVLFLFVVMMLDVDFAEFRRGALQYMPVGVIIGAILLLELLMLAGTAIVSPLVAGSSVLPLDGTISNTRALGQVIYTRYVFLFQGAGLVLLIAMIGAIVLTLRHKQGVKRQDVAAQVARTPATAIEVVKVKSGQGL
ncbi:MAG: NADH-quinone oxidoreductase subunit J [Hyphomicrobiaceae bacterium]|nr:NADH-quinone oxidoreductase subunit J [Hyphomicrobiaceae bacterium]